MNPVNSMLQRRLKENPDSDFAEFEIEAFYCKSCLNNTMTISRTADVYCGACDKYLTTLQELTERINKNE